MCSPNYNVMYAHNQMTNYKLHSKCMYVSIAMLVDKDIMASTILVEHPQQKKQSSSGGDDEQYQWHLYHEPVEAKTAH